jgi:UDP-N-acetylmuramoyl-tripeptide--D-alanyl-D-alanine ligase
MAQEVSRLDLSLAEVREALDLSPVPENDRTMVHGWSIDSRSTNPGDLFFAIKGENQDGHAFVRDAFERGAIAAVISGESAIQGLEESTELLQVPDTLVALQKLSAWARERWAKPVIAVTGSAGKTTTKDIIATLLGTKFRVGKTVGNFNNHVGLPLSLLRLPANAQIGVLELGMNHAGEIRSLTQIAQPQIGVVTNIGHAHIEAFESIEGIAQAKRELIEGLPAASTAVLNADDARVLAFSAYAKDKVITYGTAEHAHVRAEDLKLTPQGSEFTCSGARFHTSLTGRHGILNILAGLATASVFNVDFEHLIDPVSRLVPAKMRGERSVKGGITILDDSYNSNPDAVRSMIDVLRNETAKRRIAVLGEMLELGRWADALHRDVGSYAADAEIDVVVGISGATRSLVQAIETAHGSRTEAYFFDRPEQAGDFLKSLVQPGDAILFKGSRGTHVERALARLEL